MVYRSIGLSSEQTIKEAFEQAKIETIVWSHKPSGSVETIVDTTEHDEEIGAKARKDFAEWFEEHSHEYIDSFWQGHSICEALEDYERESR